jgi:hypothetical protein
MAKIAKRQFAPEPAPTIQPQQEPQAEPQPELQTSPFDEMIEKEYNHRLDLEISKARSKITERFSRLMVQEHGKDDHVPDALGHDSDYYENLADAIKSNDPRLGATKDDVYQYLYDLKFTEMRKLDAIKQEFNKQS